MRSNETPARVKTMRTGAYYAAFIMLGLSTAAIGPTLPGLAEHTRTNLKEISFLFTAHSLGYLLGSFLGGRVYDRRAGHPIMAGALVVMAVALAFVPAVSLLWLLTAALLIMGLGEGLLDVGGNTLLVWTHGDRVGPFMNGLHFFFGIGAFLSPIIVAQLVLISGDINWAYWTMALLVVPVALVIAGIPGPIPHTKNEQNNQVRRASPRLLTLISFFFFLYVGAEVSYGGWIYTYAVTLDLADATRAAYMTSAFWGVFTIGRLLGIPISARFSPRAILTVDLAGSIVCLALVWLWTGSTSILWIGTMGVGLFMASVFPVTISLVERYVTITGKVTSWFFVGSSLGGMTFPWLIGQLFESVGPSVMMFTIMMAMIVAAGVFGLVLVFEATQKRNTLEATTSL